MFVIFMANMGVWSFQTKWLAHEIGHNTDLASMTLPIGHADAYHDQYVNADDEGAPSVSEHQLLHAVDHLQLFPSTTAIAHFPLSRNPVLADFSLPSVAPAASESPFRPPRNIPPLA